MKLAIICTGGGMRCAYAGGALVSLAKEFRVTTPHIAIGVSGGAGSLVYYLTEQYDSIERIWTDLVATDKFISYRFKKPILDIDYLVDTVLKNEAPLDIERLYASATDWHFPATDMEDQKQSRFFSKKDSLDVFELLRASMAAPVVYGKKIILGKFGYQDGDMGLTVEDSIAKAQTLGATHIIVIESHLENFKVRFIDKFFKKRFLKVALTQPQNNVESASLNIIRIQNTHSPAGFLSRDRKKLRATFDRGYYDILQSSELRQFLATYSPVENTSKKEAL